MKDRSALELLGDARNFALEAQGFAVGLSLQTFDECRREQLAVRYCFAVVGEALNEVLKDIQALAPEIPWNASYGLRNRLVHGYWLIDYGIILNVAQNEIGALVNSIDRLVKEIA